MFRFISNTVPRMPPRVNEYRLCLDLLSSVRLVWRTDIHIEIFVNANPNRD